MNHFTVENWSFFDEFRDEYVQICCSSLSCIVRYTFLILIMIPYKLNYKVLHFEKYDHLIFLKLDEKFDTTL